MAENDPEIKVEFSQPDYNNKHLGGVISYTDIEQTP